MAELSDGPSATPSTAALLQQQTPVNSEPRSSHINLPLVVGLPVLLIIITAVVILLVVLIWLNYRSRKKDGPSSIAAEYKKLPTQDIGPVLNLPYPTSSPKPKIKLMDPPVPGTTTQFIEAAQLGGYPVPGSRYPFTAESDHSTSSSERGEKSRKSRRLGSRRAKDVRFRSSDRSTSPCSEDGYGSPSLIPSSPASRSAAVTPPHSPSSIRRTSTVEKVVEKYPEVFLSLFYRENEAMLIVKVVRAVALPYRPDGTPVDAYVRLFFIPKLPELPQRRTNKTKTARKDNDPVFDEEVEYEAMSAEELINSHLHVEVLDYRSYGKHLVLGQADIPLIQVQFVRGEASISLPLKPPRVREDLGTVLVSICYSPDTKKLGVIVLRAKDLNKGNSRETDAQAKIWITMGGERILGRMRTKKKAQSCSPIFNEALTCNVEPTQVKNAAVNIAVINDSRHATKRELGQVILCGQCSGEEFRHWNDVMATPGKHIAEWHQLR